MINALQESQSHHSGIETAEVNHLVYAEQKSQSHHSGIETQFAPARSCCLQPPSQSHHSGIETRPHQSSFRLFYIGRNRTTVGLKPERGDGKEAFDGLVAIAPQWD